MPWDGTMYAGGWQLDQPRVGRPKRDRKRVKAQKAARRRAR